MGRKIALLTNSRLITPLIAFTLLLSLEAPVAVAQTEKAAVENIDSSPPVLSFKHLTLDDGLSVTGVSSVLQDQDGYIWLGTQDGLNQYDGYRVSVHRTVPFDTTSLSDPMIYALAEDSTGAIWASTYSSLERRDPHTGRFRSYRYDALNPDAPTSRARVLLATSDALWSGTMSSGIDRLDLNT